MIVLHVTADDLGIGGPVNSAIRTASAGLVTDTAVLVNTPHVDQAVAALGEMPHAAAGLHLCLTWGRPVLPAESVPTLVDRRGRFCDLQTLFLRYVAHRLSLDEVRREWTAQCELFLDRVGPIQSLSSHQHLHLLPRLFPIAVDLAREFRVPWLRPARELPHPGLRCLGLMVAVRDALSIQGMKSRIIAVMGIRLPASPQSGFVRFRKLPGQSLAQSLRLLLMGLTPGRWELVCHPRCLDPDILPARHHLDEVDCLTGGTIRQLCDRLGIKVAACGADPDNEREVSTVEGPDHQPHSGWGELLATSGGHCGGELHQRPDCPPGGAG